MLKAPWTADQVDALNALQRSGAFHPFTCPGHDGRGDRTLVATRGGWICPHCEYTQDWAHEQMADPEMLRAHQIAMRNLRSHREGDFSMAEAKTSTFTIHHDRCKPGQWTPLDVLALADFVRTGDMRHARSLSLLGIELVASEHHVPKGGSLQEMGFAKFERQVGDVSDDITEVVDDDEEIVEVTRIYRGPVEYGVRIAEGDGDGGVAGYFYEFKSSRADAEAYLKEMEEGPDEAELVSDQKPADQPNT